MLECPKCAALMIEKEAQAVVYDECRSCKGIWLDSLSLDVLLEKHAPGHDIGDASDFMNLPLSEPSDLRCPRCTESVLVGTKDGISVEWCPGCRGIFLDDWELERIVDWRRHRLEKEIVAMKKDARSVAFETLVSVLLIFFTGTGRR